MSTYELRSPAGDVPDVAFSLVDLLIVASPPGARIEIEWMDDDASHVMIWDTLRRGGYVSLDMVVRHQPDHLIEEWRNPVAYVCEVAAGLYWSQRRSQTHIVPEAVPGDD